MKVRYLLPAVLVAVLSGCGFTETAATTAALAEAEAQNAKAALETKARFEKKLQEAQDAEAANRKAMDAAADQ